MSEEIYHVNFDKALIGGLPRYTFEGRIIVVQSLPEAERATDYLRHFDILGIDTETRPTFKKGITHKVSLLQIATQDTCFLFRLNMIGFPECLVRLLEDEGIKKIGLSLTDDLCSLRRRHPGLRPNAWIDLQKMVSELGIKDLSLQKLFANIFKMRISKSAQLSNWDADVLTDAQKQYAATDADACLKLYAKFLELKLAGNYRIVENCCNTTQRA